jgi:hypothetical protein
MTLSIAKTAALLAPLAVATIAAALTVKATYDPHEDELTIRVRKIRPAAAALAGARATLALR